jgi:hypothetical protein
MWKTTHHPVIRKNAESLTQKPNSKKQQKAVKA